jgi:hypothetical protein
MSKYQKVPSLEDRTAFPAVPFVLLDKLQNKVDIEALFNLCLELLLNLANYAN